MKVQLLVIAKAPELGRSKTRLSPPCTVEERTTLAEAALVDTLAAVSAAPASRRILVLDGEPGPWLPEGYDVIAQRAGGLDERLAGAFEDAGGPSLLVGMDTPQLTGDLLSDCVAALAEPGVGAVLGPASDGGWWAIGLRRPDAEVFLGVPMSTDATCAAQRRRLADRGLRVVDLPELRDVDRFTDAEAVAGAMPASAFVDAVRDVSRAVAHRSGPLITSRP